MANYSLLIVLFAALVTPLLLAKFNISRVPTAVSEIIIGIIIGRSGLNWIDMKDPTLSSLATIGVIFLIFLGGFEINFIELKKSKTKKTTVNPLILSTGSFSIILGISFLISLLLAYFNIFNNIILATIIFSTIALGVVISTLTEAKLINTDYGQTILLISVLGEFIPLVVLTIYTYIQSKEGIKTLLIPLIFIFALILLTRFKGIMTTFDRINKETTQLDVRLTFFLIFTLVTFAETIGAENILGAFLAGAVMKLLNPNNDTKEKINSIGYGFFIPMFFITTGVKLNIPELLTDRNSLLLIPIFLVCFILSKVFIFPFLKKPFGVSLAAAATSLSTTTITLVIPILNVGLNLNVISSKEAGAITIAAIITCLTAPAFFNKILAKLVYNHNKVPLKKQTH